MEVRIGLGGEVSTMGTWIGAPIVTVGIDCRPKGGTGKRRFRQDRTGQLDNWEVVRRTGSARGILIFSTLADALVRAVILGITVAVDLVRADLETVVERRAVLTTGTGASTDKEYVGENVHRRVVVEVNRVQETAH